jgi:hypothetical protein
LVAAGTVVLAPGLAEHRIQFGLADRKPRRLQDGMHVILLEIKGYPQLLQHQVVGHRKRDRPQRPVLVRSTQEKHQAVEKMGQELVTALAIAVLIIFLQPGSDFVLVHLTTGEPDDLGDLGVTCIEAETHAAQDIIIQHHPSLIDEFMEGNTSCPPWPASAFPQPGAFMGDPRGAIPHGSLRD